VALTVQRYNANPNPNPDPNPIPNRNPNSNSNLHPVLQIRAIFTHKRLTSVSLSIRRTGGSVQNG